MKRPVMELKTISPSQAKRMLEFKASNRPVRRMDVNTIAEAIQRNEWAVNGDAIRFNKAGQLVDGQHRLLAVLKAEQPIKTFVIEGIEGDALLTIDRGIRRSVRDQLAIDGTVDPKRAGLAASAVGLLLMWERSQWSYQAPALEVKRFIEEHNDILDSVSAMQALDRELTWIPPKKRIPVAMHWKFTQISPEDRDVFMKDVFQGTDRNSPGVLLARQINNQLGLKHYVHRKTEAAWWIKAWNAHREGEQPLRYIYRATTEEFPVLV